MALQRISVSIYGGANTGKFNDWRDLGGALVHYAEGLNLIHNPTL
jgi:hypothetical protein